MFLLRIKQNFQYIYIHKKTITLIKYFVEQKFSVLIRKRTVKCYNKKSKSFYRVLFYELF